MTGTRRTLGDILAGGTEPQPNLLDLLGGPGQVGRNHPSPSGYAAQHDQGGARARILTAIEWAGTEGLTSKEIAAARLSPSVQLAGARLQELRGDSAPGPDGEPRPRLIARLVNASDPGKGQFVTRDGAAVHVTVDTRIWSSVIMETPPVPLTVCPCCGHTTRTKNRTPHA